MHYDVLLIKSTSKATFSILNSPSSDLVSHEIHGIARKSSTLWVFFGATGSKVRTEIVNIVASLKSTNRHLVR